jgi:hypothetical protein
MKLSATVLVVAAIATVGFAPSASALNPSGDTSFTVPTFSNWTTDVGGPNDQPGQKDLTAHASKLTTDFFVAWKWDEISISGGNTGDACPLFDSDGDGNANTALCVTIAKTPTEWQSTRVYTCGDTKPDRCTSTYAEVIPIGSKCQVDNQASPALSPGAGAFDTQATCKIALADFGVSVPSALLNTCSYPSREPTSAPSDCVLIPGVRETGAIEITKVGASANCTAASATCQGAGVALLDAQFSITGTGAPTGAANLSTGSDGKVCLAGFPTGSTYRVTEDTPPIGYKLNDYVADIGVQAYQDVAVSATGTCSSNPATVSFNDTPESSMRVIFDGSAAGPGVTRSQIICKQGTTVIDPAAGADSGDNETTPTRDDASETFNGLTAGVYTCTIDINP